MRAGFPHSDILGSKLVCQLPEAFRRLPRPSSPVIAKASTTCTLSLDPITLSSLAGASSALGLLQRLVARCSPFVSSNTRYNHHTQSLQSRFESRIETLFYFFQIFKDQPYSSTRKDRSLKLETPVSHLTLRALPRFTNWWS